MHLENLDVELVIERFGNLPHHGGQEIDAEAHVAGFDDAGPERRRRDDLFMLCGEAGGADDVDKTMGGRLSDQRHAGMGNRKIDEAIRMGEQRRCFRADRDAGPRPANSPASRPITGPSGASIAPANTTPSVSAIALITVRPIRPPAPATTSSMSDIGSST